MKNFDIKNISKPDWKLHEGGISVCDANNQLVASCGFLPKKSIFESKANAKLISMSPKMFKEIEKAIGWIEKFHLPDNMKPNWYISMKKICDELYKGD